MEGPVGRKKEFRPGPTGCLHPAGAHLYLWVEKENVFG